MILLATIGGLFTLLFWGISDYYAGKSGKQLDEYLTVFIIQLPGVLILLPLVLWQGLGASFNISLFFVALSSLFFFAAYILYVKALTIGPFGVIAPIGNTYPLVTLFLGITFLGIYFSIIQFMAFVFIIVGIILLTFEPKGFMLNSLSHKAIYFAGGAAVFYGIGFIFIELVLQEYAWFQLVFLVGLFMTLMSFATISFRRKALPGIGEIFHTDAKFAWMAGGVLFLGSISFFFVAEQVGSVIILAVIASASPLVTLMLARAQDDEKLSLLKKIGAVIVVAGIMLLNL